ncbi:formyltetrahydrofolate deformylase [Derxia gummosa]|uniref:Formyltetrahydrofolate deformylase n=1 Tax=Derxia gummosa DSM 723 TaxID=1121388 RepID=A0A8B6X5R9_9BURK|nr:formyltetrahydrofolate deformylase [Derxia gummosa]
MNTEHTYTLALSCPDRVGIVAAVSGFLADRQGWILESNHHADQDTGRFFMRNVIKASSLEGGIESFVTAFGQIASSYEMNWRLSDSRQKKRVVLLVSKQDHCLVDLMYRWRSGDLGCDIACVISNHDDLRKYVEWHDVPYFHVPVTPDNKVEAYAEIDRLFGEHRGDVMVLARYMQILSPQLCDKYPGRIINIHHSFLPSFIGARPYHQAFDRGVKLIGATSHYVTSELDAGPIIEQDVVRIDHGDTAEDLVRYGRDVEKNVLSRALKYHLEDRVLLNGKRTVVFR